MSSYIGVTNFQIWSSLFSYPVHIQLTNVALVFTALSFPCAGPSLLHFYDFDNKF